MPPYQRLTEPWVSPEQLAFLESHIQSFQDTMDDEFGRKRFWADVREQWLYRWDMTAKQSHRLSSYFRQEMERRGVIPKRVRQPNKVSNNKSDRAAVAPTTRQQAPKTPEPESTQSSSRVVEDLLIKSLSPPISHSPTPGPSRVCRSPTPAKSPVHRPSPSPALSYYDPPTHAARLATPVPAHQSPAPRTPPALESVLGTVTVLPPATIWTKELSRSLAFHLDLPGIAHRDVEVAIRGRQMVVYARNDKIAYKWSTDVGGQAKPEQVQCGLVNGALRILIKVSAVEKITDDLRLLRPCLPLPSLPEIGIDIVGDDNKILHHKVAARIFNEQDPQIAHRSEQHQQLQHHQQVLQSHGGPPSLQAEPSSSTINNSSFHFVASNGSGPPRRTSSGMHVGIAGFGRMGGGMRARGLSGLTFEHILNRLQGELQKR
ncbi:hypothetical protein EYR38_009898 [Pleurotus pulmonarius]|nr:hypothetical protein EYR38_009898 [Pleurotus pulmonarius]